ncbi:Cadherin-23 [Rhizoctonia solani]|uniref:Cadherin-23 n=1 Tax=Rhizoctonia solani TaxID=456999 RepID=A0A0K6G052_9AGAM|nr:Cadherin-23 [Rhizoctonia solani]
MRIPEPDEPSPHPQEAQGLGLRSEVPGLLDNNVPMPESPTQDLSARDLQNDKVEHTDDEPTSNESKETGIGSASNNNNHLYNPPPGDEIGVSKPDKDLDGFDGIPNFFRLLDIVEDRSCGGIVEKIVIDQQSLSKFINLLQPGSYKSVSNIDFNALDELSIKPIGVYGSQMEVFKYLVTMGCLDDDCETAFFQPDFRGKLTSALHSGLYLTMCHGQQTTASSKTAYLVYWPESNTWDDQESAETVTISNTLRRNRETFMRFLTKLCDQTIALVSASQADAFVWERSIQTNITSGNRQENSFRSRVEEFHVLELDEQEDDVIASSGFEISVEELIQQSLPDGARNAAVHLVGGETKIGLLVQNSEEEQIILKPINQGKVSMTELRRMFGSEGRYHLVLGAISPESLEVLATNGLEERYPNIFNEYHDSQAEAERNRQSTEAEGEQGIENAMDQDKFRLAKEIRHQVCEKYSLIYPSGIFQGSNPVPYDCEMNEPLRHDYKLGFDQIRHDMQKHKIDQVNNSEFRTFKSKWIPLRDRLSGNSSASRKDQEAWVCEVVDGVLGPSDPGNWLSKLIKLSKAVANMPSKIAESLSTEKLSDSEFVAELWKLEQTYACLTSFAELIYHILLTEMEKFTNDLIAKHLEKMVSFEKQTRYSNFKEECARVRNEDETTRYNQLIQSLKQAMSPQSDNVSTLCVESIQREYRKDDQGVQPTSWLCWSGTKRTYLPPRNRYHIYPFEFTTHDRQQSELNEDHVPNPKIATKEGFDFAVPTSQTIEFAQLVHDKCLLVISDVGEGHIRIYVADNMSMESEIRKNGLVTLSHEMLGGAECVYAFDQTTRFFAIVHGHEDPHLSIYQFDRQFTNIQRYCAPTSLRSWYEERPKISAACFQTGRSELILIESSGSVHTVSITGSADMVCPAPFHLDPSFVDAYSAPDGSCLLVVVRGTSDIDPLRLVAFHWDTSDSEDQVTGIEISDLPPSEATCVVTRFYGKGRTHVVSFLPVQKLVQSTILQIKQRTTEFSIRSENEGLPAEGTQTVNNSILDCHLEVWTRFPIVPTITRFTPFPISRKPRQLVFVSPIDLPRVTAYFERMISTVKKTTHKPIDRELTSTLVSTTKATNAEFLESLSEFKLGSFIVELICLIPIQIAVMRDNKFMPLKDGVWDPEYESGLVGLTIDEASESLSFGWYESLLRSYMAKKGVRVVSSMGEQSVGKSYCLNHFADTSFAGSAMRTTEGAWLSCTPTSDYLLVSLDFEGLQSTERSPQEDMLLVLFNTAISNLILFRNNFAVSRNVRALFTGFELSAGTFDPNLNPGLFQSTLATIIKDVTDADIVGIKTEFHRKFSEIVKTERKGNFISKLHKGKILIIPWPVIDSPGFYSLFELLREKLEGKPFTHQTGGGFLYELKMLMVKIKEGNWDPIDQSLASSRAHQLKKQLKMALSNGATSEGPLKNMNIDKEIATLNDEPTLFVPEDSGTRMVEARDLRNESKDEFEKQQEENSEKTLKTLIQRCELLLSPRSQSPDSDYVNTLQEHLDKILDRRLALVELWINVNTDHLPQENQHLGELNTIFDFLKRDMRAAVRLCRSGCASCGLQCLRPYSHSKEHNCSTDHKCKSFCAVSNGHSGLPPCGLKAGHTGKHMCDVSYHLCGSDCKLRQWAGCTQKCTKPLDHQDGEHLCSAPSHYCGKPCDLRNVSRGNNLSNFDCPGICQKPWNEVHEQHSCNTQSCPIPCILCARSRSIKNAPECCSTDHLHGLNWDAIHLCRADHECLENCEANGICHIDFTPSDKTCTRGRDSYVYTRHEQIGKKLPCKIRIPQGEMTHRGPHNHDPEKNEHRCDAQCPGCKYYCTHSINHRQRLHATVHGSMIGTQWIVESEANEAYKIDEHRYVSGDSGDNMFCHMLCVKQGRHAHIDFCRDPLNHSQPLCEHMSSRVEPEREKDKDWISHATYWERTGFEDPYGFGQQTEFAKCDARCSDPAHGTPSECILPIFHAPKSQTPSPSRGYISQDGHQFTCVDPANVRQAYHIVFVIDNSASMSEGDITPDPTPMLARLKSEGCDNRYGAVVSALYRFWKIREGHQVSSSSLVREDHYSVVVFDDEAEARVSNDWCLTTNQLVDKLIPQKYVGYGGTNFEEAIKIAHEVIERNWSSQRAPILIFLSDGEDLIEEQSIRSLCNLSVKLGQALAFYAMSFGRDSESDPLRLMVSVAEQVFHAAPTSAKGAYKGQDPPCKYFSNTKKSIELSNTFVKISKSLPKLRASVMNKTGASGRY